MRRSLDEPERPGKLDFPGGGVEEGENVVAAVAREVREETGYELHETDFRIVFGVTMEATGGEPSLIRILFTARVPSTDVTLNDEHDEYYWTTVDEVIDALKGRPFGDGIAFAKRHGLLPI